MDSNIKITECPRDAMQGIHRFIPTETKIAYLNALLKVGFETIDFGSFVSPKAIPQLADTAEVLAGIDASNSVSKLLAIVANYRGAEAAVAFPAVYYLGYPFSLSETFQLRNTRKTIAQAWELVQRMKELCDKAEKKLHIYFSMGFGNPYDDPWDIEVVENWASQMESIGIQSIGLADTVGGADTQTISDLFHLLIPRFPAIEFGAHFHAHPDNRAAKIAAAWTAGCRNFDTAMKGFGGCPFAEDDLVGNIATESLLHFCDTHSINPNINGEAFRAAMDMVGKVFSPV